MKGYLVTFFTQQNRRHAGCPLGEWLVSLARELNLRGATLGSAVQGFGHTGALHAAHFFELADQPLELQLAVTEEECGRLFARLEQEDLALFYVKAPVELGFVGRQA